MSTTTQSMWPKSIELPADPILALLREQGSLLGDVTEGLLQAVVRTAYVDGIKEEVSYHVRPVNGFMQNMSYMLLTFKRGIATPFPFTIEFYPLAKEKKYSSLIITDLEKFRTELSKGFKSETTGHVIANMMRLVQGQRDENT